MKYLGIEYSVLQICYLCINYNTSRGKLLHFFENKINFFNYSVGKLKEQDAHTSCSLTKTGNVLFSQAASRQVSSALGSLTSVFEMGTGGSSPPLSPDHI